MPSKKNAPRSLWITQLETRPAAVETTTAGGGNTRRVRGGASTPAGDNGPAPIDDTALDRGLVVLRGVVRTRSEEEFITLYRSIREWREKILGWAPPDDPDNLLFRDYEPVQWAFDRPDAAAAGDFEFEIHYYFEPTRLTPVTEDDGAVAMQPRMDQDVRISWIALAVTAVVVIGTLAWYYDWGEQADAVTTEARRYLNRTGELPYAQQLDRLRDRNADLANYLEELQAQVGIREVPPFLMPPPEQKPGEYFTVVYSQIWSELQQRASRFSIENYDYTIGFGHLEGRPPATREEVRYYLTMLQLVTKAVYFSLSTPDKTVQTVAVRGVDPKTRLVTGPDGRPPLLLEYPFELEVRASLKDILWLLHQLSDDQLDLSQRTDEQRDFGVWLQTVIDKLEESGGLQVSYDGAEGAGNEICPLIVRGLTIVSGNLETADQVTQLDVVIQLAGMEFLTPNERQNGVADVRPERTQRAAASTGRIRGTSTNHVARP